MAKLEMEISETLRERLKTEACLRGESEEAVLEEALLRFFDGEKSRKSSEVPPTITDPEEVVRVRKAAAGIWKDRNDLPSLREMRGGWDQRLQRLFGNG